MSVCRIENIENRQYWVIYCSANCIQWVQLRHDIWWLTKCTFQYNFTRVSCDRLYPSCHHIWDSVAVISISASVIASLYVSLSHPSYARDAGANHNTHKYITIQGVLQHVPYPLMWTYVHAYVHFTHDNMNKWILMRSTSVKSSSLIFIYSYRVWNFQYKNQTCLHLSNVLIFHHISCCWLIICI